MPNSGAIHFALLLSREVEAVVNSDQIRTLDVGQFEHGLMSRWSFRRRAALVSTSSPAAAAQTEVTAARPLPRTGAIRRQRLAGSNAIEMVRIVLDMEFVEARQVTISHLNLDLMAIPPRQHIIVPGFQTRLIGVATRFRKSTIGIFSR
jgi:hypothetical protein